MEKINFIFNNEAGLHARPAGELVKIASEFKSSIVMKKDGKCASAKGLFAIMGLSVKKGDKVEIEIEGEDEKQAKEAIKEFLEKNSAEIQTKD
ncbi:MAG: HPr family phosphocarrier protein [Clostridia bacterium]|nr:HPr family phosphocarrier protein [Clostridia bacterium]